MKKNLTITVSIAAFFLSSCNNDLKQQDLTEKESQEEQQKNGRGHYILHSKESSSNDSPASSETDWNKSSTHISKGKVSRGGFGHTGGLSSGG